MSVEYFHSVFQKRVSNFLNPNMRILSQKDVLFFVIDTKN